MPGALDGIRVIDFGQYIAGPLAGMLLADQGAHVIKVDPPGGPCWNTPGNATWNRGKRSIVLDLKREADLATARALVQTADVVGAAAAMFLVESGNHDSDRPVYTAPSP